jgi:hypothetical protein
MLKTTIKIVGSIVGRFARGRPQTEVAVEKTLVTAHRYIRVKNPGPTGVFIKGVRVYPPIYGIAKDHSVRADLDAARDLDARDLLRPGETRDLRIIDRRDPSKVPRDAPSRFVYFFIFWRKNSSTSLPQVPVMVTTSTHDLEQMAAAATRRDDVP